MTANFKFQCIFLTLLLTGCTKHKPDEVAIVTQVKRLRDLATVRYSIQRVVGMREAKQPVGEESILLMVEGRVTAGVDLSGLSRDDVKYLDPNTVSIDLPEPKILDTALDEGQTKIWDRQVTWWTPWIPFSPDLEHRARLKAIDDVREAALKMGILDQAQRNGEMAIREFLDLFGIRCSFRKAPS